MSKFIQCECYNGLDELCDCIINVNDIIYMNDAYRINRDTGDIDLEYVHCYLKTYSGSYCARELYLKGTVKEIAELINKIR